MLNYWICLESSKATLYRTRPRHGPTYILEACIQWENYLALNSPEDFNSEVVSSYETVSGILMVF